MAEEPTNARKSFGDIAPHLAEITDKVLFVFLCVAVGLSPIIYGSTDTIIVLNFEFASFIALVIFGIRLALLWDNSGQGFTQGFLLSPCGGSIAECSPC